MCDRSDWFGKDHLNCMRVLKLILCVRGRLLDLLKAWAENIANEWLSCKNFKQHYIDTESETQISGLIIIVFICHSARPYKNYSLKCILELKHFCL